MTRLIPESPQKARASRADFEREYGERKGVEFWQVFHSDQPAAHPAIRWHQNRKIAFLFHILNPETPFNLAEYPLNEYSNSNYLILLSIFSLFLQIAFPITIYYVACFLLHADNVMW